LAMLLASALVFSGANPALAVDDGRMHVDRLERLERRVNEMAERQEQFMRQLGGEMERQAQVEQARGEQRRLQLAQGGGPPPTRQPPHTGRLAKSVQDMLGLIFLIAIICNILLSIWIFTDIRKRGQGSGIFIALALVAGIPAAIIYTLIRIGDQKISGTKSEV